MQADPQNDEVDFLGILDLGRPELDLFSVAAAASNESAPALPEPEPPPAPAELVPTLPPVNRKRRYVTTYDTDGKRHRTVDGALPQTRGECLARARAAKAEKALKDCKTDMAKVLESSIADIAAKSNVRLDVKTVKPQLKKGRFFNSMAGLLQKLGRGRTAKAKRRATFSATQLVEMASAEEASMRSICRSFKCGKPTAYRSLRGVAMARLIAQEALMNATIKRLKARCANSGLKLSMAQLCKLFDETQEKIKVSVKGKCHTAPWNVFVATFLFYWKFPGESPEHFLFIVPPIPVPNTKAESLWAALHAHRFFKVVMDFRRELFSLAEENQEVSTVDQASSNKRLHGHELTTATEAGINHSTIDCSNHNIWLGMMGSVKTCITGKPVVHGFVIAKFMNAGTHKLRCALACRAWVLKTLDIQHGEQSESDATYGREVVSN